MISIGGVIGQGLFLSSGANLNAAGKEIRQIKSAIRLNFIC